MGDESSSIFTSMTFWRWHQLAKILNNMTWLLQVQDIHVRSSLARTARLAAARVTSEAETRRWLGDEEGDLAVFRTSAAGGDVLVTVATGGSGSVLGSSPDIDIFMFFRNFQYEEQTFPSLHREPKTS